ncbi:A-kinase anchor protein 17A-like isoform X2 [Schistocerca gregaria]|uniref:A-kinase anchor protein 17A-like isoform X2 n=1 Tax=Schistocerca gregaria TaxID=7010 RepID=UPI00211E2E9A|nr:A-kinase anchor protein 17A-like isoform X2 [Schistocerca gregaria]
MNVIKICEDMKDAVELFSPQGLYLKPIARLNISVQLPLMKFTGKTITNSELMDKLKSMIFPDEFITLKVVKSTLEFIRFEGEIENKSCLQNVIGRLDTRTLKLANFSEPLKIRAAEAKIVFPTRHNWDAYFRDAKNMNETKHGERPDTIYISNLPYKWFTTKKDIIKGIIRPSEYILQKVFEVFGDVRCIDIPATDPFRNKMKSRKTGINTFSFDQERTFEAYIQYKEYICFVKAMDSLRGMKLLYKEGDRAYTANIKVDFDRTKHLSDESIQRRRAERERLITERLIERERILSQHRQQANNLERQKKNCKHDEERRYERAVTDLQKAKADDMKQKIDEAEKQKHLIVQQEVESLQLLNALFERIKVRRKHEEEQQQKLLQLKNVKEEKGQKKKKDKIKKKHMTQEERAEKIERELRERLIKKYKRLQKLHVKAEETEFTTPACDEQKQSHCSIPSSSKQTPERSPQRSNSGSPLCHKKKHKKKHKRHKHKSKTKHRRFHRKMEHRPYFKRVDNYIYTGCNNYFYHSPTFQCVPGGYATHDFFSPHWNPEFHGRHFSHQTQTSHCGDINDGYCRYFKKSSKARAKSAEESGDPNNSLSSHSRKRKRSGSREECSRDSTSLCNHPSSVSSNLSSHKHEESDEKSHNYHKNVEVQTKQKKKSKR